MLIIFLVIACSSLSVPSNGRVNYFTDTTGPHDFGTVATFTCNPGFSLDGAERVTCGGDGSSPNGIWSELPPTCTGKNVK